jgi:hypothetical protein
MKLFDNVIFFSYLCKFISSYQRYNLLRKFFISIILSVAVHALAFGEEAVVYVQNDSMVMFDNDSVVKDSVRFVLSDSVDFTLIDSANLEEAGHLAPRSNSAIESRIDYKAKDSIFFDLRINTVHLFEKAQVNYKDIELTAAKIEIHFDRDELTAFPKLDSLGEEVDRPFFKDERQMFEAREMVYNLATKKARIKNIVTKEDEMFIHGDVVKKLPNNEAFVQRARFTTCDLEHPHFHIVARRAKIIPSDKVVTGGAMIFLNDVPTPLAVPFGLFPNSNKRSSGILIPSYGESRSEDEGFFLRNGGFYLAMSDYADWRIEGDIYSRGAWELRNTVQYAKLYKFNGRFEFRTGMMPRGERGTLDFEQTRTTRIGWNHQQDRKANENSTFAASVDFFNKASQQNSLLIADRMDNQSTSNISYQLRLGRFNVSSTANMDYNISSGNITLVLPTINLTMSPIFPLKPKIRQGNPKWYESFNIGYSINARNTVRGNDSAFWNQEMLRDMQNGAIHNIPMSMNVKVLGGKITWNHTVQYREHWNFKANYRGLDTTWISVYDPETKEFLYDSIGRIRQDIIGTEYGFFTTRSYDYSTNFSTRLFGMAQFKRGLIRAFRHVMDPSIGFRISPDFETHANGWREYEDESGNIRRYNLFQGSPGGHPSGGRSGSITFNLGNNFEMKVRDKSDTVRGERNVKLIDRLTLGTSYNLAADRSKGQLPWAPITLTANTTLFKKLQINYRASFSLYARDSNNRPYDKFIWETGDKFLLRESESMNTGLSWTFNSKKRENAEQNRASGIGEIFEQSAVFGPDWSLNVSYTVGYTNRFEPGYRRNDIWGRPVIGQQPWSEYDRRIQQTLSFNGNLNLTEKWSISFSSGWDFIDKKISQTMLNITRDLHCWTMDFTWAPFGNYREWSFNIRLVSNMLGDVMKYDKKRTHREMYQ